MRRWFVRHRQALALGSLVAAALTALGGLAAERYADARRGAALGAELQRGAGLALALAGAASESVLAANPAGAEGLVRAFAESPGVFIARVVLPDGSVLAEAARDRVAPALSFSPESAESGASDLGLSSRFGLAALSRARTARLDFDGEPLAVHYFPVHRERSADPARPGEIAGWAQIALSLRSLDAARADVAWNAAAWLGGSALLGLLLGGGIARRALIPLARVVDAAEEAARGAPGFQGRSAGEADADFAARGLSWALGEARAARAEAEELRRSLDASVRSRTREYEHLAERALESSRVKSEFLANMSHELRTPLNSVIGFGEVLESEAVGALNAKQKKYVANILGSGRHLLEVINDILDLSKIEAGRMVLEPGLVNLGELVQSSLAVVAPRAREKSIALSAEVAPGLDSVSADGRKLKQALYNLLANAVKFTPEGGSVAVRAACTGADVRIAVSDTGIGIAPADRERIFRPFEQADSSSMRRYEGTGLGLALTRRFLELHDGTVELESEPGRGSTFTMVFPFIPGDESAALGADRWEAAAGPGPARRVPAFACLARREGDRIARAVRAAGGDPVSFDSPAAIAERIARGDFAPAAVVVEIQEIARGGWSAIDAVLAEARLGEIPVAALCANAEDAALAGANAADARVVPAHLERLAEALGGFVRRESEERRAARVLLVDPQAETREALEAALRGEGYEVFSADSALRGLLLAGESSPDLVVLELAMPGMDGFEALRRLRMQPSNAAVPVVVHTDKDVTMQDRRRLAGQIDLLAFKGQTTQGRLLQEVRAILARRGPKLRDAA